MSYPRKVAVPLLLPYLGLHARLLAKGIKLRDYYNQSTTGSREYILLILVREEFCFFISLTSLCLLFSEQFSFLLGPVTLVEAV